jgi:hypothetical protein
MMPVNRGSSHRSDSSPSNGTATTLISSLLGALTQRLLAFSVLVVIFLCFSAATRLVLALNADASFTTAEWFFIFSRGLLYDFIASLYFALPFALWLVLTPNVIAKWRLHRAGTVMALAAFSYGLLLVAVAEWLFWQEFGSRFNFIAVDYLLYTHEVWGNIRESYPVVVILATLLVPVLAIAVLSARSVWRSSGMHLAWRTRFVFVALYALIIAVTLRYVDSDLKDVSPREEVH